MNPEILKDIDLEKIEDPAMREGTLLLLKLVGELQEERTELLALRQQLQDEYRRLKRKQRRAKPSGRSR